MLGLFSIDTYLGERQTPIILWGSGYVGRQLLSVYEIQYMNYNIVAVADNDSSKQGIEIIPKRAEGIVADNAFCQRKIEVISACEVEKYCREYPEYIIVIAVMECYKQEIFNQIAEMHLSNTVVYCDEFKHFAVREYIELCIKKHNAKLAEQYYACYYNFVNHSFIKKFRPLVSAIDSNIPFVTIVSPPKTGGNTISDALTKMGIAHLHYHNGFDLNENPENPDKWVPIIRQKCTKYIIGIREPIAQNISLMYNQITNLFSMKEDAHNLDAQWLFDHYVVEPIMGTVGGDSFYERELMRTGTNFIQELYIQHYFQKTIYSTLGIDIYQIEFDKQRGCTIAECEGKQIFLYQIEKLNFLKQDLADFLKKPSIDFEQSNNGLEKYYHNAYKRFVQEFTMPKDYFEYSYGCDFTKHFYSDTDIEKFKAKWRSHVI